MAAPALPSVAALIAKKRDGGALDDDEIRALIAGFVRGEVADYQMSALAMAIVLRGMTDRETTSLTFAMRDSGEVVDLSEVRGIKVDKHSTGGVGDKVSLCLAPLVAACGIPVPMMSGRGLGHTGGTLDKLEAIPGMRVGLSLAEFRAQIESIGCAMIGQTAELAPADRRLYALRDVTATVESIPLITASILSKKLAEGTDALVMDVKVGRGAFMKSERDARALAKSIVRVGTLAKKRVSAILTRMDVPLGRAVGNALETAEAFAVLRGEGPDDVVECTMLLGSEMLRLGGVARTEREGRRRIAQAIASGDGLRRMQAIVRAQGGDARSVDEPDRLPHAAIRRAVPAPSDGYVTDVDAMVVGLASVALGAGRRRAEDMIDPAVGFELVRRPGDPVRRGDPIAFVHANDEARANAAAEELAGAYRLGRRAPKVPPLLVVRIKAGAR